jgi:hypothetical protein
MDGRLNESAAPNCKAGYTAAYYQGALLGLASLKVQNSDIVQISFSQPLYNEHPHL